MPVLVFRFLEVVLIAHWETFLVIFKQRGPFGNLCIKNFFEAFIVIGLSLGRMLCEGIKCSGIEICLLRMGHCESWHVFQIDRQNFG